MKKKPLLANDTSPATRPEPPIAEIKAASADLDRLGSFFYQDTSSNMSGHVGCAPDSDRNCAAMQQVATGHSRPNALQHNRGKKKDRQHGGQSLIEHMRNGQAVA
jgi:hypothetical protein